MKLLAGLGLAALYLAVGIGSATAAQNRTSDPTTMWCPPYYYLANGQCTPHGLNKPRIPTDGGYDGGLPGREQTVCEWETGGYFICPGNGKTNPRPK